MSRGRAAAVALMATAIFAGAVFFTRSTRPPAVSPVASISKVETAVLGAEWGMRSDAVQARIGRELVPAAPDPIFYRLVNSRNDARAAVFEAGSVDFGAKSALLRLLFLDGKLAAYYLFFEDEDDERLDREVRAELTRRFGENPLNVADGTSLKAIWPLKSVDVNYWLIPNEFRLRPNYRAAIGVKAKTRE